MLKINLPERSGFVTSLMKWKGLTICSLTMNETLLLGGWIK